VNWTVKAALGGGTVPDGSYAIGTSTSFNNILGQFSVVNGQLTGTTIWPRHHTAEVFYDGSPANSTEHYYIWKYDSFNGWTVRDGNDEMAILIQVIGTCTQVQTIEAGTITIYLSNQPTPTPTPGVELKCTDAKVGGNQAACSSCGADSYAMARYSIHEMLVSLNIQDTPIRYSPPYGPNIGFTVTYNQKDTQQPATFNYSNLGPKWTLHWLAYVSDDPNSQLPLTGVYMPGGGAEVFAFDSASQAFRTDPQSHATLVKVSTNTYERRMPDGSKYVFAKSDGATAYPRRIFLTEVYDSANNKATIEYDDSLRIVKMKDAQLKETIVSYELTADPFKITKVTDPSLRYATFQYDASGRLQTITDEIGIQSTFGYDGQSDFVNSITTPYGATTFTKGESGTNRWVEATDPDGGKEHVEYRDNAPGIGSSESVVPKCRRPGERGA
jgi:YD repeat-containing protein